MANGDLSLELAYFNVNLGRPYHTGEITALYLVRINKNEVPYTKPGQVFGYQ